MRRSRGQKLLKRHDRVCCEAFEIVAQTCPNVFCDPAWQESLWNQQLRLALDRLEMAQGDLKKAKAKKNAKKEVEAAKKEVEAAKKEVAAAKKEVAAAEKKKVAAGLAQARSACN